MSDVNGNVTGIQGIPVNSAAPNDKDALLFDGGTGEWVPGAPPQPLEPWVGTVNTQAQVIQRIPWTCRTTGTTGQSLVAVVLATDTALSMTVSSVFRHVTVVGSLMNTTILTTSNAGGTLTAASASSIYGAVSGAFAPYTNGPTFELDLSGTTATLKVTFYSAQPGTVVECQGYVDLMVI